jgi:hypothetical protein
MSQAQNTAASRSSDSSDLFGQTLRTVAVLVGVCVLFVGSLSTAAVLITSKAMASSPRAADVQDSTPAAPKKPLSI